MQAIISAPIAKHLVLIGGGHSHLAVLKRLGMKPLAGLSVTLISRDIETPYSGCLPGYIANQCSFEDSHIDLRPLAQFAGVRLIQSTVTELDLERKRITLDDRPAISFDALSLNIGSKPQLDLIRGASDHAIAIKPIDRFIASWDSVIKQAKETLSAASSVYSIAIVGGGPASIELALSTQQRIQQELKAAQPGSLDIKIITADDDILQLHNAKVQSFMREELSRRNINIIKGNAVTSIEDKTLNFASGEQVKADHIVLATGASIPSWPFDCGLEKSSDGFIAINSFLQSSSHPFVFAAGDAATIGGFNRPKSGVYAVRQGPPLAKNLIRYLTGRKLKPYKPQKSALALINLGNKTAIASRDSIFFHGHSVWRLKQKIDSDFVRKYSEFPEPSAKVDVADGLLSKQDRQALKDHAMRCAGCGAKVGSSVLSEVLSQLPSATGSIASPGSSAEDAAIIEINAETTLLQSVDQIKAPINDPWLFARIASNHCLSDIYAMGAEPHSALAIVGLPYALKKITRETLSELMLGCSQTLEENQCQLVGGHSAESMELTFGLSVNGFAKPESLLKKQGMNTGDVLILTKPLGTGTLLAADMRRKAKHRWIAPALEQMLLSNREAAKQFRKFEASSCTDITGFGLVGHLLEMLEANNTQVELTLSSIPTLDGAVQCLKRGITSSLHEDNKLHEEVISNKTAFQKDENYPLLFDPQTSGGLLASIKEQHAKQCLQALLASGHRAAIIGKVLATDASEPAITLMQ